MSTSWSILNFFFTCFTFINIKLLDLFYIWMHLNYDYNSCPQIRSSFQIKISLYKADTFNIFIILLSQVELSTSTWHVRLFNKGGMYGRFKNKGLHDIWKYCNCFDEWIQPVCYDFIDTEFTEKKFADLRCSYFFLVQL